MPGDFPSAVLAEAEEAARRPLPSDVTDLRAVPFRTLDPVGARDLDQAYAIEETSDGFVVRYAIAHVAHFVEPGGAVDAEAHRRGVTIYLPGERAPLHPPVLSEGAASLLPGVDRPALVWTIEVPGGGTRVERALVCSREQLAYDTAVDPVLERVGEVLLAEEAARGGVALDLPAQEVVAVDDRLTLRVDPVLPIERWNAQLSLLTGRAAATLMLDGGVGILRTMPPPDDGVVRELRRLARALDIPWADGESYAAVVRRVDRGSVRGVVFLQHARRAMRGAGYTAFDDGTRPALREHSAVAAPYAHVTAPLRRLADRYALEVCLALCAGVEVPAWVRAALPRLPEVMGAAMRKAAAVERAVIDEVEAMLLSRCVGAVLDATVVSVDGDTAVVAVDAPVVVANARSASAWAPGDRVGVRVVAADVSRRHVELAAA